MNDFPVRETNYTATNLEQNKPYEFRVCAVNKAGNGAPSDPTPPVTPRDPDGTKRMLLEIFMIFFRDLLMQNKKIGLHPLIIILLIDLATVRVFYTHHNLSFRYL